MNKRKSKQLKAKPLPIRTLFNNDTTIMPISPSGCTYFSIHDAMNEYEKFGKGIKLIEYWISKMYILHKKLYSSSYTNCTRQFPYLQMLLGWMKLGKGQQERYKVGQLFQELNKKSTNSSVLLCKYCGWN
jgi:hypothetical protein